MLIMVSKETFAYLDQQILDAVAEGDQEWEFEARLEMAVARQENERE